MNIYEKLQMVKKRLSERELKKTGENKFSGFKYYELGDFLPSIIELCDENKLFTQITFTNDEGILLIVDSDSSNAVKLEDGNLDYRCISYTVPMRELELKGANAIQALGGVQTYLRRYLYMNAFDIVEADMFDSAEFEKKKKQKADKSILDELISKCKSTYTGSSDEIKAQVGGIMKKLGYGTFADLNKKQVKNDVIMLADILKIEIPAELKDNKEDTKKEVKTKGEK